MRELIDFDNVCAIIGYEFKDKNLLLNALTHSSYAHQFSLSSNERLEFLGDAVLDFLVGDYLYQDSSLKEGDMSRLRSRLVSSDSLSNSIFKMGLNLLIGDSLCGVVTKSMREDLFEALVGAIYLDGGLDSAKKFIFSHLDLDVIHNIDYKTQLQEIVQKVINCEPFYDTLPSATGDEYVTNLYVNNTYITSASAHSKKQSQVDCAKWAIENIDVVNKALHQI